MAKWRSEGRDRLQARTRTGPTRSLDPARRRALNAWQERRPRQLRGVLAKVRHGSGEVENVDDESGYTVHALEFQLPVADHPGGPDREADPADIDERELRAVDDEVAAGP